MKKTLIALMALAGVAAGATPIIDATFENNLPEGFNYSNENGATYVDSGLEGYGMAIDFDKSGYVSTSTDCTDYTGLTTGSQATDFTIVTTVRFDSWAELSDGGSVENRLFICGSGNANDQGIGWTVANGVMGVTVKDKSHNPISNPAITLSLDTWYTLAFTYDADTSVATFYANGSYVGALTLEAAKTTPGSFNIGGGRVSTRQAAWDGAMADFKVYDTTLSAAEVAAFGAPTPATPAIPEPATATLSLLALCGLASRRRRK